MPSAFEILNNICQSTDNILVTESDEKDYAPYFINRGLGMGLDTILFANEMNKYPKLDKTLQYDYLRHSVSKSKRYNKWAKTKLDVDISMLKEYYKTTWEKAREIANTLSERQIKEISDRVESKKGRVK